MVPATAMNPAVTGARSTAIGVIRAVYAAEFIAVTIPPIDEAVTLPSVPTSTTTVQLGPPAAQLNTISPWTTDWPAGTSTLPPPAMKPDVTLERSTFSGVSTGGIVMGPSPPPPPQPYRPSASTAVAANAPRYLLADTIIDTSLTLPRRARRPRLFERRFRANGGPHLSRHTAAPTSLPSLTADPEPTQGVWTPHGEVGLNCVPAECADMSSYHIRHASWA